jgi:pimeloyl-ACP methyl ester carboxylesterase
MNDIKSKIIKVGTLNIRYIVGGTGEPLLIIHGGNGNAQLWSKNAREFYRDHTVYIPDLPGFGKSEAMKGRYYVDEYVNFIANFVKVIGIDKFYLMGHSLGGAIAASYALQYPQQVKKLVLIDSIGMDRDIALWIRLFSNQAFCVSFGRPLVAVFKGIKWTIESLFRSMEFFIPVSEASLVIGCAMVNLQSQTMVLKHRLSEIVVPTLIFWGKYDPIVPMKHAYTAAEVMSDCRVVILSGGHNAYAGNRIFSSETTRFLS